MCQYLKTAQPETTAQMMTYRAFAFCLICGDMSIQDMLIFKNKAAELKLKHKNWPIDGARLELEHIN